MDFFNYNRRPTVDVRVGNLFMGGNHPVVVQTMTNTNTLDTEGSVEQCERIVAVGADLIRLTTQGVREANNLREIHQQLRDKGYTIPLSADIHFNPRAAEVAATIAEKVRINPGNYVDKQKRLLTWSIPTRSMPWSLKKYEPRLSLSCEFVKSTAPPYVLA